MSKRARSAEHQLPKRVQSVIARLRGGQKLCKSLRLKETGETEITFTYEPSGRRVGPKPAAAAIATDFVRPTGDGLLGPESSQTFIAA